MLNIIQNFSVQNNIIPILFLRKRGEYIFYSNIST